MCVLFVKIFLMKVGLCSLANVTMRITFACATVLQKKLETKGRGGAQTVLCPTCTTASLKEPLNNNQKKSQVVVVVNRLLKINTISDSLTPLQEAVSNIEQSIQNLSVKYDDVF